MCEARIKLDANAVAHIKLIRSITMLYLCVNAPEWCAQTLFLWVNIVILQFAMRASYQRKIRATACTAPTVDAVTCCTGRHIVHSSKSSPSRPAACFCWEVLSVNHGAEWNDVQRSSSTRFESVEQEKETGRANCPFFSHLRGRASDGEG